jgi:hypothetical protein
MKFDHRFNTRNQVELRQLKAIEVAAVILEDKLNLSAVDLTLQAQRQAGWAGTDAYHCGMYVNDTKLIKVNFRNLRGATLKNIIIVLAHEFRHAVQHSTGLLDKYHRWTGPEYKLETNEYNKHYIKRPSEIDAREYQSAYAQLVINDERFSQFVPYLDESYGEKPMKVDWDATYGQLPYDREGICLFRLRETGETQYWLHLSQINAKKWTKSIYRKVFDNHVDLLKSQRLNEIKSELVLEDLLS